MFTEEAKTHAFQTIVKTICFWISIDNANCAASFISLAECLPLNTIEKSRINRLIRMYDNAFSDITTYEAEKAKLNLRIPQKYMLETEMAYSYVCITAITNYIDAKLYEEAYSTIMSASNESNSWRELYLQAISIIKNTENKEAFCKWCVSASIVAMDIKETNCLDYGCLAVMYDENAFEKTSEEDIEE